MSHAVVDAVVLAAGASTRTAPHHKLLARGADGRTLLEVTLGQLRASRLREIVLVVGASAPAVVAAAGTHPVRVVHCPDHARGLSCSLQAGLNALHGSAAAVLIALADMPLVTPATIDRLIGAWQPGAIVVPMHLGRRGNPVLWDAGFIPAMLGGQGDRGAQWLLGTQAAAVHAVAVDDAGVLRDADTAAAVRALPGGPWRGLNGAPI